MTVDCLLHFAHPWPPDPPVVNSLVHFCGSAFSPTSCHQAVQKPPIAWGSGSMTEHDKGRRPSFFTEREKDCSIHLTGCVGSCALIANSGKDCQDGPGCSMCCVRHWLGIRLVFLYLSHLDYSKQLAGGPWMAVLEFCPPASLEARSSKGVGGHVSHEEFYWKLLALTHFSLLPV